jgi:Transmembrane secretion effector
VTFGGMAAGAMAWGLVADLIGLPGAVRLAALWLAVTMALLHLLAPMPTREEGRVM